MFCFQCQEAAQNKGCTIKGVCGKTSDVSDLQDLLIFILKGISKKAVKMRQNGSEVPALVNRFIVESLFMTITNANFDKERFVTRIKDAIQLRDSLKVEFDDCCKCDCHSWKTDTEEEMENKDKSIGVLSTENEDVRSLRELLIYGVKGMAAYTEHAYNLGYEEDSIYQFIEEALVATTKETDIQKLINLVLGCGEMWVKALALLDKANTSTYGNP